MIVDLDGTLVHAAQARVSYFDGAYRFGDAVFTTLRAERGRLHRFGDHVLRLSHATQLLQMPATVDESNLRARIDALLRANDLSDGTARLRIQISRGGDHLHDPLTCAPEDLRPVISIETRPLEEVDPSLAIATLSLPADFARGNFPSLKTGNYLASLMALRFAHAGSREEAIVVDRAGHVLEAATSNVFAIRGGTLRTPSLDLGVLAGITRARILALAERTELDTEETVLLLPDLLEADEVFVTNAVRGIRPVGTIDDQPIADGRRGPWTERLQHCLALDAAE